MDKLTIEQKAKAYDKAIENGKQILNTPYTAHWDTMKGVVEYLLPELKESEDERIRKELLEHCKNQAKPYIQTGNECPQIQSWIAWLEKQSEKPQGKSALEAAKEENVDNQNCVKPADKIEPKFHEGDIVKRKDNPHLTYILKRLTDDGDYEFHAIGKDGNEGCTCFAGVKYQDDWELVEQKTAWSEEDERIINSCIYCFEQDLKELKNDKVGHSEIISDLEEGYKEKIDFLKSLKSRVKPQPKQEWSEEDEKEYRRVEYAIMKVFGGDAYLIGWIRKFKNKLLHQTTWKPSDEQIDALETAVSSLQSTALESLYNELKKL